MQNQGFSFSGAAIRGHIGTLMLSLAVIVLGFFFATKLQVDLLPAITYPRIAVQLNIPGISPQVAIDEVTRPLESSLASTEGVNQIFSRTQEGRVRVDLFFNPGSNVDQALNDVTATYNRGRNRLPDDIEDARIFKFDPSQLPVYELALTSPSLTPLELRIFADDELVRELSIVPGVAAVDIAGGVQEEVRVNLDFNRLQAQGIGLTDVLNALTARNQDISGGRLEGSDFEPLTRTVGRFTDAKEINDISFEVAGKRVYLRDFAEVVDGSEDQRVFVLLNGEKAVKVSVQKQPDANTVEVVDAVKKKIETLRTSGLIPRDSVLTPTLDDSKFIKTSIDNVTNNGLSGAALAAITVLLFLGSFRQTLIILLSLPLSALASIILMNLCGFSLNLFSLGGLALGIGNVMDNSIVMVETISEGTGMTIGQDARSQLSSEETIDRAESSSKQVESAFVASTTTNIVALLPFLLVGGFISLLFNELVLTIVFSVIASIVVAVTVVPALASRLFAVKASSGLSNLGFLQEFNRRFMHGTANYASFLKNVLKYRLLVVIVTFLILGGSAGVVVAQIPQEILPAINTGQVQINAQFPAGTTLVTNRKVMTMVDEILKKQPETDYTFTVIGGGIFGSTVTDNPLRGSSTVTLKPQADVFSYVQRVNGEVAKLNLAGIRVRVNPGRVRGLIVNNSPTPGTDVDVILQGNDYETLQAAGRQVLRALEDVKGANFRPDSDDRQPETQIKPNWERLQAFGLTVQDIGQTIQTAIEGSVPTQIQRGNRLVDVRVRFSKDLISQPSQLERLPLFTQLSQSQTNSSQPNQNQNNRQIRLADVATVEDSLSPGEIQRINQRQVYILNGSLNKGGSLSSVLAQVGEIGSAIDLPEGVSLLPSSAAEANDQLQNSLKVLGGLACFLVFVVMAVQYNSLIDPLVIMFTIPLALAGGVFGLYITQTSIGATVIMGAVLLVGIVVNNAIIMVELANQIREQQKCDRFTAITTAAPQRFRAILMTAITTVLGAFPLALGLGEGGEFLRPLGVVVFSGLSLSTLLTLFIIPCFYLLLHEFSPKAISRPLSVGLKYKFRRVFRKSQS